MISKSEVPPARIFTTRGTVLYVDPISGELRHGATETSPENAVLVAESMETGAGGWGRIVCTANGRCESIICRAALSVCESRAYGADRETGATRLELLPLERGLIALRADGQFLCAEPTGRITLSRPVCSLWECFLASKLVY